MTKIKPVCYYPFVNFKQDPEGSQGSKVSPSDFWLLYA